MNPEVKAKWLAALRSEKYAQTTEVLRDCQGYCCLGVLTDLYLQEKGEEWKEDVIEGDTFYHFDYDADNISAPVIKWSGLDSCDPDVVYEEDLTTLTCLNDERRLNFKEIAKIIEEQL